VAEKTKGRAVELKMGRRVGMKMMVSVTMRMTLLQMKKGVMEEISQ